MLVVRIQVLLEDIFNVRQQKMLNGMMTHVKGVTLALKVRIDNTSITHHSLHARTMHVPSLSPFVGVRMCRGGVVVVCVS